MSKNTIYYVVLVKKIYILAVINLNSRTVRRELSSAEL